MGHNSSVTVVISFHAKNSARRKKKEKKEVKLDYFNLFSFIFLTWLWCATRIHGVDENVITTTYTYRNIQ
jgi:hypothetical protein